MKAIQTKYLGPTNCRGPRIVATAEGGHRVTASFDHSGKEHERAVRALCKKLGWSGRFICGGLPDGSQCWVFADYGTDLEVAP